MTSEQPMPHDTGKARQPVGERLKQLIDERTAKGIATYGEPLHTHNGRDAERDALEESLDLNQYLMQRLMEVESELAAALAEAERLRGVVEKMRPLLHLAQHANRGAWSNGVTDASGSLDEGDCQAMEIVDDADFALRTLDTLDAPKAEGESEARDEH